MNIVPVSKSIKELLLSQKQFVIPRFQREYSWERKNYQEFLEDIISTLKLEKGRILASDYFLGTMLFIGDFNSSSNDELSIVDGQQRLTTITILFSAMAETLKNSGEIELNSQLFKYIVGVNDDGEKVRVIKTTSSYPFFAEFIQDNDKTFIQEPTTEEELMIKDAYYYFFSILEKESLIKLFCNIHPESSSMISAGVITQIDIIKAIRDQVLGCIFIAIATTDKGDANRLFEILNGKGKSLSYIDLIKNRLFEALPATEPSDFATERWKELKRVLSNCSEPVGLATYYRHYWISKYKNTSKSHLYDSFARMVKKKEYRPFLVDLVKNAKYYMECVNPSREFFSNRKEYYHFVQCLRNINLFDVTQTRVIFMSLLDARDRELISSKALTEVAQFIEDFHFIYTVIVHGRPNTIDSIYSKFASNLRKLSSRHNISELIKSELIIPLKSIIPKSDLFIERFIKLEYSKAFNPSNLRTKYVINRLNSIFAKAPLFPDDLSIEHICSESEGGITYSIGNLIALELDLNNDAGQMDYNKKKTIYRKSKYEWVKQFTEKNDSFNHKNIEERAISLATIYYNSIYT